MHKRNPIFAFEKTFRYLRATRVSVFRSVCVFFTCFVLTILTFQVELDTFSLTISSWTAKGLFFLINSVFVTRSSFDKVINTEELIRGSIVGFSILDGWHCLKKKKSVKLVFEIVWPITYSLYYFLNTMIVRSFLSSLVPEEV